MKNKALLAVNFAVLLFGLAGLFARWVHLPAIGITFGRVFFSSIALALCMGAGRIPFRLTNRRDLRLLLPAGIILALHWWAFLEAIRVSTVAIGTITFSAFPLFVTFLEPVVFREKLSWRSVLLAVVLLIGVLITIPSFSMEDRMLRGILIGLLSALAYAILTILNRRLTQRCSSLQIAFYEQSVAALVLLPFVLGLKLRPSAADIGLLAILGVCMTALAHTLFISSLKKIPAQLAGICSAMEMVYSMLFALLLLGEVPSLRECIGAAVIFATVVTAQLWEKG